MSPSPSARPLRATAIAAAIALVFTVAGCGGDDDAAVEPTSPTGAAKTTAPEPPPAAGTTANGKKNSPAPVNDGGVGPAERDREKRPSGSTGGKSPDDTQETPSQPAPNPTGEPPGPTGSKPDSASKFEQFCDENPDACG